MRRSLAVRVFVALACLSLPACGSAALRAAERGDAAALRTEIAEKHAKGKLSNDEAADLARAVAERELTTPKDEATRSERLHETRACALELDDALEDLAKRRDGVGAEAALSRLENGKLSNGTARDWLDDPDDRWRAVGVRTLRRDSDRKRRQSAMIDPSPRVRRSAIRAAAEAGDIADLDVLFETARVDPEPMLRNEAIRASSAILRESADSARPRASDLAVRLRDLWTAGDDAVKEDVAVAWGLSPVFESGGREALRVAMATGKGPGAIAAAGVALGSGKKDAELASSAENMLAAAILDGSRRDRMHALVVARAEGPMLDALRKAAQDDDRDVKVAVLARLLESKTDRDAAKKELFALAGYGVKGAAKVDDERGLDSAARARQVLASAGDLRVQAWIEEDLASGSPQRRAGAAYALGALGRVARAAPLLADADPSIRTRVACTIIVASRH